VQASKLARSLAADPRRFARIKKPLSNITLRFAI